MTRISVKILFCVLCVSLLMFTACTAQKEDGAADTRTAPSRNYTMAEFLKTTTIAGGSFNHSESKLLVSSNESGVFNVYELDLATSERTAVTEGDDTTFGVSYMPTDDRILYTRDQAGDENNHLFLRDLDGTVTDLTNGEATKESFWGFNNDLKTFFTINNERDARFFDVFQWDAATLEKRMIYRNESGMQPSAISADTRWLALDKPNTTNDSDIYMLDLEGGGEPRLISGHEGEASFSSHTFSVDSKYLYYTSNADGEFASLRRFEVATDQHEDVYASEWDVVFTYYSRLGTYHVTGTNEDGYTKVRITRNGEEFEVE